MGKAKNLTGQRFGRLTVLEKSDGRSGDGSVLWRCRCDCGGVTFGTSHALTHGRKQSCGCIKQDNLHPQTVKDLTGQRFGMLVAIKPVEQRTGSGGAVWLCECDCGCECHVSSTSLVEGNTKSCGCLKAKQHPERWKVKPGDQFGRLIALEPTQGTDKYGSIIWQCHCTCGNDAFVSSRSLRSGKVQSCGCLGDENREMHSTLRYMVENTNIAKIKSKRPYKGSKSRGVWYNSKRNRYVPTLKFKGKSHYLGQYMNFDEAVAVRKAAEEKFFKPFIEEHSK